MVQTVKLSSIVRLEDALRTVDKKKETYIALKEDIAKNGVKDIFTVYDNGDGTFTLGNGDHRYTALCELHDEGRGSDEVEVRVEKKKSDREVLRAQVAGNATVTKTTNKNFIKAIYKLATGEENISLSDIAKDVGMTESYIMRLIKSLRLKDEVLEVCEKEGVSITNLITLADMAGKVEVEEIIEEYVPEAKAKTGKEFAIFIAEKLDELKAAAQGKEKVEGYQHKPKLRTMDEIQLRIASEKDPVALDTLKWVISSDEPTIEAAKLEWEAKKAERDKKRAERAAAREAEKQAEMVEKLKEQGFEIKPKTKA